MILHVDMDAFFASVEQRDDPRLKNRPIVVSGHSKRSVVAAASYEARKFGVHSAMPVFQARQKCPHLIIVPGNREKYSVDSKKIMAVLSMFSPLVEPVSIDEAYVDVSGCQKLLGSPQSIALNIKQEISNQLGLTCSIGIAPVKFLAKIASDMNKPDGLTIICPTKIDAVIKDLPIEKVPGVGKNAMNQMNRLNIKTLGDIRGLQMDLLKKKFGKFGSRLFQLSRGIDKTPVETGHVRKSISSETTLAQDIHDFQDVSDILLSQSQRVGRDLRKKDLVCKNVAIKIKFSDFTQITRSKKTAEWICSSKAIFDHALALYSKVALKKKIRLIGVGVSRLRDKKEPVQMDLLQPRDQKIKKQWETVDSAVDAVAEKFGTAFIQKASLTKK
ncbi:DNA polymerase IV [Desulfonema ishimotonii]|uniref:DNA polymerase IV n=1 Tax=Desulfonema ishimotonii TaxID=45657 RepID=A0A401G4M1_9BACT|nr:DNA polymerase IV [Desulfonema ishimotonii]GBC64160.1 DNA polymerase IV [Desulfonema ishimotonii]